LLGKNRGIVALDDITPKNALRFAKNLQGLVWGFKINSLFEVCPKIVEILKPYGKVLLDLKIHEIPFTAGNEVKEQLVRGADIITVHASGGTEMMNYARLSADVVNLTLKRKSLVVAVTVLTSLSDEGCKSIYGKGTLSKVLQFSEMAICESHLDGIVCSSGEVKEIKKQIQKDFIAITPGIRLASDSKKDQKRTDTPYNAILNGADLLVIGRPITQSKDPVFKVKEKCSGNVCKK